MTSDPKVEIGIKCRKCKKNDVLLNEAKKEVIKSKFERTQLDEAKAQRKKLKLEEVLRKNGHPADFLQLPEIYPKILNPTTETKIAAPESEKLSETTSKNPGKKVDVVHSLPQLRTPRTPKQHAYGDTTSHPVLSNSIIPTHSSPLVSPAHLVPINKPTDERVWMAQAAKAKNHEKMQDLEKLHNRCQGRLPASGADRYDAPMVNPNSRDANREKHQAKLHEDTPTMKIQLSDTESASRIEISKKADAEDIKRLPKELSTSRTQYDIDMRQSRPEMMNEPTTSEAPNLSLSAQEDIITGSSQAKEWMQKEALREAHMTLPRQQRSVNLVGQGKGKPTKSEIPPPSMQTGVVMKEAVEEGWDMVEEFDELDWVDVPSLKLS